MINKLLNNYFIIDLTHTINANIPTWPGTMPFEKNIVKDYDYGCCVHQFRFHAGTGTHMDAPAHFIKNSRMISDLSLTELIVPACILDISKKAINDPDYHISVADINAWENQYGEITSGSIFLAYTGWSNYWPDENLYRNMDSSGVMHFPGFSKEAATFLLKRNVVGIGIDTLSLDPAIDTDYGTHHVMLGHNKYQLENLANLDKLPPTGAILFILPLKIEDATEAPIRVIAFAPKS